MVPIVAPVQSVQDMQSAHPVKQLQSSPSLLFSPPSVTPPPYTSFTPVSPWRSTINTMNVTSAIQNDSLSTKSYIPAPRIPEVPLILLPLSSSSSSIKNTIYQQGLLVPYIPAPYEKGPNGLSLIVPRKINSSMTKLAIK